MNEVVAVQHELPDKVIVPGFECRGLARFQENGVEPNRPPQALTIHFSQQKWVHMDVEGMGFAFGSNLPSLRFSSLQGARKHVHCEGGAFLVGLKLFDLTNGRETELQLEADVMIHRRR